MTNNEITERAEAAAREAAEYTEAFKAAYAQQKPEIKEKEPSAAEIFKKMSELQHIMSDTASMEQLITVVDSGDWDEDAVAEICGVYKAREDNFRRLLEMYERMYSDTKSL